MDFLLNDYQVSYRRNSKNIDQEINEDLHLDSNPTTQDLKAIGSRIQVVKDFIITFIYIRTNIFIFVAIMTTFRSLYHLAFFRTFLIRVTFREGYNDPNAVIIINQYEQIFQLIFHLMNKSRYMCRFGYLLLKYNLTCSPYRTYSNIYDP